MSFISVDLTDFESFIDLLEEKTRDENIQKIAEKGLSAGFEVQQEAIKNSWTHETPSDSEHRKSKIVKPKTMEYLLYDDTPLWNGKKDMASLGTGFLFDNDIDPMSPNATGGIIAQYLAYGTKTKYGVQKVKPDDKLKRAIVGKAIKDKTQKTIEDTVIEEFGKIFKEL